MLPVGVDKEGGEREDQAVRVMIIMNEDRDSPSTVYIEHHLFRGKRGFQTAGVMNDWWIFCRSVLLLDWMPFKASESSLPKRKT